MVCMPCFDLSDLRNLCVLCRFIPAAIELHEEPGTEVNVRYLKLRAGPRMYISEQQQALRAWYRTQADCLACCAVTPAAAPQHV